MARFKNVLLAFMMAAAAVLGAVALQACCELAIETDSLPPAARGVPYFFEFESGCGGDTWSLSQGTLPPGIALAADGELSGLPSQGGTFFFTVLLEDFSGDFVYKGFSLLVSDPDP